MFLLSKDEKAIFEAEDINDLYMKLHKIQGQSWSYALSYGGYKITKKETVTNKN